VLTEAPRSPDRPNPIGLHPVTVLAVDGGCILVERMEADERPVHPRVETEFHPGLVPRDAGARHDPGMDFPFAVTVRGLRKRYGDRTVVDGIDLDVHEGELLGLIGANGAGKTTTVECIQGITRPDDGAIRVFGVDPAVDRDRVRRLIGSQLQDSSLPDRLRVDEAVDLFATAPAAPGDELLEQFGLAPRRRAAFASLSGGERQRLFLVLALLNRPRLVILDELTQGLDPSARRGVWSAVDALRREGTTVVLVTHELDEAEALCDRVVAMRAGRILATGTPAELVDRFAGTATVRFTLADGHGAADLAHIEGVLDVTRDGRRVTVVGDRTCIAHVGAALVRSGPVPTDLSVEIPDLEDALLQLLDDDALASVGGAR
jgi:ABC-2 type transport system ATP-binding protein